MDTVASDSLGVDASQAANSALSIDALATTPRSLPLNPNPFKELRNKKGLTLQSIAVRVGVSQYLIIRTEQGCFATPPPKLLNFFVSEYGVDEVNFLKQYHAFQRASREDNGMFLGPLPTLDNLPEDEHPFEYWRSTANKNNLNLTEVSKMLCVAQPVLYHFEKYPRRQGSVPRQLIYALEDAGYDRATTDTLKDAYARYREYLRTRAA